MNCRTFARILADLLEGNLLREDRTSAEEHERECAACRRLRAVAEGKTSLFSAETDQELTRSILHSTSGSACPRAEASLCDYIDGNLDETTSQLVGLHLNSCASCRELADGLEMLREVLPEFAELDPGRDFTSAVASRTSAFRPLRPGLRVRFQTWWVRMAQRPRFSFEAAYLGTLVLVLAFNNPVFPVGSVALRKLDSLSFATAAREVVLKRLPSGWIDEQAPVRRFAQGLSEGASQKGKAAMASLDDVLTRGGQLSASSYRWQVRTVSSWITKTRDAMHSVWSRLFPRK